MRKIIVVGLCCLVCSCAGPLIKSKPAPPPNMRPGQTYTKVHVATFSEAMHLRKDEKKPGPADAVRVPFRNMLANELKRTGKFTSVTSGQVITKGRRANITPQTLVVRGEITAYSEGNSALRLFVGHGIGAGEFAATANLDGGIARKRVGEVGSDSRTGSQAGIKSSFTAMEDLMRDTAVRMAQGIAEKAN